MAFITINHSLNQTYLVSKEAFEQAVKIASKNSKLSKTNEIRIDFNDITNDFRANLNVLIKKGAKIKEAITELQSNIEDLSINLIDSKPENISIDIDGEF